MDEDVRNELDEIKLMILGLRQQIREVASCSASQERETTTLKGIQKRVLKQLDKAQLMKAIKHYIEEGYSTNNMRDEIMLRFTIRPTCFFKHLKLLRQQLRKVTTRSDTESPYP